MLPYGKEEVINSCNQNQSYSPKYDIEPSSCKCYISEEAVPDVELAYELAICILTLRWLQPSRSQPLGCAESRALQITHVGQKAHVKTPYGKKKAIVVM